MKNGDIGFKNKYLKNGDIGFKNKYLKNGDIGFKNKYLENGDIGLAGRRLLQFLLHKQHSCSRLQLDPLSSSPSSSPSLLTSSTRWQGGKNTLYGIDITEVSECKLIYQKY